MSAPTDFDQWSREDLIARIRQLEQMQPGASPVQPAQAKPSDQPKPTAAPTPKKTQRPFDFSKYSARHVALKVAYLGHKYSGLQAVQAEGVETIESHLFQALVTAKLIPDPKVCNWSRCGRTDKGVSSFGQVFGVYLRSNLPKDSPEAVEWTSPDNRANDNDDVDDKPQPNAEQLKRPSGPVPEEQRIRTHRAESASFSELPYVAILNRLLPRDIRVLAWSAVDKPFSARFNCTARRYKYFFPAERLNVAKMRQAARYFRGVHDFRHFCKVDPTKTVNYERTVYYADVFVRDTEDGLSEASDEAKPAIGGEAGFDSDPTQMYVFVVKGQAFLWHQVRCMVAILFLVGRGLEEPEVVLDLLDLSRHPLGSGRPNYDIASEYPLVLVDCEYPEGTFDWQLEAGPVPEKDGLNEFRLIDAVWSNWKQRELEATLSKSLIHELALGLGTSVDNFADTLAKDPRGPKYVKLMQRSRADSIETKIEKQKARQAQRQTGDQPEKSLASPGSAAGQRKHKQPSPVSEAKQLKKPKITSE
ncbi:pseudouridine synthase [Polychytrium aggregatum]|uniref:pseudouridine synthase n=1 Tax=Polychytrium aggregatum TaxID=110093 RepID=UPI0022FDD2BD|nr:pseudouridine synthase [Polychytrium aggregatum]KAI9206003.1 pseudouridine synthase [Polychytrium aggregatum]